MMSKPDRSYIGEIVRERAPTRGTDLVWAAVFAATYNSIQCNAEYKVGTEDHDRLIARCVEQANAADIGLQNWQLDEAQKKAEREQARRGGSRP